MKIPGGNSDEELAREHSPGRMPWLWIAVGLLLFVIAGAVAQQLLWLRGTHRQTTTLRGADVTVSLAEVVSGKHLEFHEPWLLRWVDKTPFPEILGFRNHLPVKHEMKHDGVGVFLFEFVPSGGMLNSGQGEFSDGKGWQTTAPPIDWTRIRERPVGQDVALYAIGTFPRSSPRLRFRLLDYGGMPPTELARIDFANPFYDNGVAVSASHSLPVSAADRDLSVTLQQLVTGVRQLPYDYEKDNTPETRQRLEKDYATGSFSKVYPNEMAFTVAEIAVCHNGKPATDWAVTKARFQDPSGGEFENLYTNQKNDLRIGEHYYYCFSPMMWTGEGPFKLKFDLARDENFSDDELLTVTAVVPAAGKPPAETLMATVGGTSVTFQGICGAQYTETMSGGSWRVEYPTAFLVLEQPTGFRAKLTSAISHATSQPVQMIPGDTYDYIVASAGPRRRRDAFGMWSPAAGTTITLTFAVTPTRTVEFEAEPTQVK